LRIDDVRKVLPALPREAVLQRQFPEGVHVAHGRAAGRISAEALQVYLSKSTAPEALRFRNWLDREVLRPAAIARGRHGSQR
jgi:hypothetical protein